MKTLILLRHAKAVLASKGQPDRARALSSRGERDAPVMGAWIVAQGLKPDQVLVSSAERTQQTWELAALHLDPPQTIDIRDDLYLAPPQHLLKTIQGQPSARATLLLIGHNTGLEQLAALLVGHGDADARARMEHKFPTAACAVITVTGATWDAVRPGKGRLTAFQIPRELAD